MTSNLRTDAARNRARILTAMALVTVLVAPHHPQPAKRARRALRLLFERVRPR